MRAGKRETRSPKGEASASTIRSRSNGEFRTRLFRLIRETMLGVAAGAPPPEWLEGSGHLAAVRFLMLAARLVVLWGVLQAMAGLSGTAHIAIGGLGLACGVTGAVTLLRIRRGAGERPADRG